MKQERKKLQNGGVSAILGLLRDSFFFRISVAFGRAIRNSALNSFLLRWLTKPAALQKNGLFYEVFVARPSDAAKKMRLWIAGQVENSLLSRLWNGLVSWMLALDVISWGGGLLAFGLTLLSVTAIRSFRGELAGFFGLQLAVSAAAVLCGFLCATCREPLGEMLLSSGLLSRILVGFVGVRKTSLSVSKPEHGLTIPVAVGALLALVTLRIRILYMGLGVVLVLAAALVLSHPETGLLLILLALPFLPTMVLTAACLYVDLAFFFKLLRCKRALRLEPVDLCVAAYGLVLLLLGGVTSFRPASSIRQVAVYGVFILTYFVTANGIRSKELARKAVFCLLFSCLLASLLGVYQNFAGVESTASWIDKSMFAEISSRIVGPFDNPNVFGEYLIMLLPLALATLLVGKKWRRLVSLGALFMGLAALIYTWSRGAWLGAIASVGMFLLLYHPFFLYLVLPGLLLFPFFTAMLPPSILNRFTSIANLADTSTAYRVSIWTASVRMLRDVWSSGIGTGSAAFTAIYPAYALGGAAFALHAHNLYLQICVDTGALGIVAFLLILLFFYRAVFSCYRRCTDRELGVTVLSIGLGVAALLVQGLTDNVWYNFKIVLLFWLLLGLAVGMGRDDKLYDLREEREELDAGA